MSQEVDTVGSERLEGRNVELKTVLCKSFVTASIASELVIKRFSISDDSTGKALNMGI